MKLLSILAASISALALATSSASAQSIGDAQATVEHPSLFITVSEAVPSSPDIATVGVGVQTLAAKATTAMGENSEKMERVIAMLKARGILTKDIQTTGISLSPQYDYQNQKPGVPVAFLGYQVNNTVRVTTTNIAKLGELLDALIVAGGNSIDGPYFSIKDNKSQAKLARDKAVASANTQAQEYAIRTGFSRARLLTISEGANYGPQPVSAMNAAMYVTAQSESPPPPPPPIAPGQVATVIAINLRYQLEK
jgi:uncharacterized protein